MPNEIDTRRKTVTRAEYEQAMSDINTRLDNLERRIDELTSEMQRQIGLITALVKKNQRFYSARNVSFVLIGALVGGVSAQLVHLLK